MLHMKSCFHRKKVYLFSFDTGCATDSLEVFFLMMLSFWIDSCLLWIIKNGYPHCMQSDYMNITWHCYSSLAWLHCPHIYSIPEKLGDKVKTILNMWCLWYREIYQRLCRSLVVKWGVNEKLLDQAPGTLLTSVCKCMENSGYPFTQADMTTQ